MCKWNPDNRHPFRRCGHGHRDHEELYDDVVLPNHPPGIWCNACRTLCAFYSPHRVRTGFKAFVADILGGHPIPQARPLSQVSVSNISMVDISRSRPSEMRHQTFGAFNEARSALPDMNRFATFSSSPGESYSYPRRKRRSGDYMSGDYRSRVRRNALDEPRPSSSRRSNVDERPPPSSAPSAYERQMHGPVMYGRQPTQGIPEPIPPTPSIPQPNPFFMPPSESQEYGMRSPQSRNESRSGLDYSRAPASSHPAYNSYSSNVQSLSPSPYPPPLTSHPSRIPGRHRSHMSSRERGRRRNGNSQYAPPPIFSPRNSPTTPGPGLGRYDSRQMQSSPGFTPIPPVSHPSVPPSSYRAPNAFSTAFSRAIPSPNPPGSTPLATPVNEYYYNQTHRGTNPYGEGFGPRAGETLCGQPSPNGNGHSPQIGGYGHDTRRTGYGYENGNRVRFASDWERDELNGLR